jgi:hypothetical protein
VDLDDAQLFGQSRTLRIKQLLGLAYSMANLDHPFDTLDLAAPSTVILHTRRFSCPFVGLPAQPQPVAEIVQCGEPSFLEIFALRAGGANCFPELGLPAGRAGDRDLSQDLRPVNLNTAFHTARLRAPSDDRGATRSA